MDHFRYHNKRIIFLLLFLPSFVLAVQGQVQNSSWIGPTESVESVAQKIYKAIVQASGISALLMIVWGGAEYAFYSSTGDTRKVGEAKERIQYALYGLFIVLLSWLLLYIINPEFVT